MPRFADGGKRCPASGPVVLRPAAKPQDEWHRVGIAQLIRMVEETPPEPDLSSKRWSGAGDLNPGPHGPEPCALPNCASPRRRASNANSSGPGEVCAWKVLGRSGGDAGQWGQEVR
jgi:hypothetical protein